VVSLSSCSPSPGLLVVNYRVLRSSLLVLFSLLHACKFPVPIFPWISLIALAEALRPCLSMSLAGWLPNSTSASAAGLFPRLLNCPVLAFRINDTLASVKGRNPVLIGHPMPLGLFSRLESLQRRPDGTKELLEVFFRVCSAGRLVARSDIVSLLWFLIVPYCPLCIEMAVSEDLTAFSTARPNRQTFSEHFPGPTFHLHALQDPEFFFFGRFSRE